MNLTLKCRAAKISNVQYIEFVNFVAKRRKTLEKLIYEKKNGVTERLRLLNPRKAIVVATSSITFHAIT